MANLDEIILLKKINTKKIIDKLNELIKFLESTEKAIQLNRV